MSKHGKVTIYQRGMMGYYKREVMEFEVETGVKYAQFDNAVRYAYRKPRARRWMQGHETTFPSLVVLSGWGHFDPKDSFEDIGDGWSRSRHSACSSEWSEEFDAALSAYIERTGAEIVFDARGNHPYTAKVA